MSSRIILDKDIYKNKTLLLRKGSVLDSYLLQKLNNFGISNSEISGFTSAEISLQEAQRVLIVQKNRFDNRRIREIIEFAGFAPKNIFINNDSSYFDEIDFNKLNFLFIDDEFFTQELAAKIFMGLEKNRLKIFVLNHDINSSDTINFNSDFISVKYLHKPLAKDYIKALIKIYG
ncbi:MAG: hypothetical protein PHX18_06540 [Candidatus Gastranaerophilales bacterium]|nr:hypothetical protein [Candidatus Gastranaerophilales bacterium]